jgi:hypothetical protein
MSIYDNIKDMVLNLERLEHRLYKHYPHTQTILNVKLYYRKNVTTL